MTYQEKMDVKILYAVRGWIAFVAFMDLGTAMRSYIEKQSFLSKTIYEDNFEQEDHAVSRVLGVYFILKALVLIYCALYIHYRPVLTMGMWSLLITVLLYFTEAVYFKAATLNFSVIFPFILNVLTLGCLLYIQGSIRIWDPTLTGDETSDHTYNISSGGRKKRSSRKY